MRIAYCEDEAAQAGLVRAMISQWADSRQEAAEDTVCYLEVFGHYTLFLYNFIEMR